LARRRISSLTSRQHAEDFRRRAAVDVLAVRKAFTGPIAAQVGEDAQLDLE